MKKRAGFTLLELVTVIVILGIIGVSSSKILGPSVDSYLAAVDETKLAGETWIAVERISRELRHALSVLAPTSGSSGSELTFTRNPCLACVDKSTWINFSFTPQDGKLWRTTPGSGAQVLADNVVSFSITAGAQPSGKRTYTISLTRGRGLASGRDRLITLQTTVHPPALNEKSWEEVIQ